MSCESSPSSLAEILGKAVQTLRSPMVWLGAAAATTLLAGACFAALGNREALEQAGRALSKAPLALAALTLTLPALSWLGTTGSLWCLMRRVGCVGVGEMAALLGVAAVMNYLPGRPGMLARVAYHKRRNDIPVRASLTAVVWMTALGAGALALLAAIALALHTAHAGPWATASASLAPAALTAAIGAILQASGVGAQRRVDLLAWALCFRSLEMLAWAGRYWAIFALLGAPLEWPSAIAISAVSNVAMALPVAGNGLGVREWLVGLLAPLLPGALASAGGGFNAAEQAMLVEVTHRGVEIAVALPLGIVSALWLTRRSRKAALRG